MRNIQLRIFAQVDTKEIASNIADQIILNVKKYSKFESQTITKYWKIPEYYEIYIKFKPINNPVDDFSEIRNILATGWEDLNSMECLWNPSENNSFFIDEIKWAQLECTDPVTT